MKIKGPLLSFRASKSVGRQITYRDTPSGPVASLYRPPTDPTSPAQIAQRARVGAAVAAWRYVIQPAGGSEPWQRLAMSRYSSWSGYNHCLSSLIHTLTLHPDLSYVVDADPFAGWSIRWRLRDVISDRYAREAGDYQLFAGPSPTQMSFVENLSLVGSCLFSSALATADTVIYASVSKDGYLRSGIHKLTLSDAAWLPIAYKRTVGWWIHQGSLPGALIGVYPDRSYAAKSPGEQLTPAKRPAWTGDAATSLLFDGTDDSILFAAPPELSSAPRYSIALWHNMSFRDGFHYMFETMDPANRECLKAYTHSTYVSGGLYFEVLRTGSVLGSVNRQTMYFCPLNTWGHIAYVFDGSLSPSRTALLAYANGVLSGGGHSDDLRPVSPTSMTDGCIGAHDKGVSQFFQGKLAEILLWDTDLAPEDILDTYTHQQGLF